MNTENYEFQNPRRAVTRQLIELGGAMRQLRHLAVGERGRGAWHDPSQGQGRVLALLKLQPETTQRELTFLTGMSRQALAELLAKLEAKGLVEREPSTTDRRVVVVRLTDAGREAEQASRAGGEPKGRLLDVLTDDEVDQLAGFLTRIEERVHTEIGAKVAARGGRRGPGPWDREPGRERGPRGGRGQMPGGPWGGPRGDVRGDVRGFRPDFPGAGNPVVGNPVVGNPVGPRGPRGGRRGHGC